MESKQLQARDKKNLIISNIGMKGSGKSALTKQYIVTKPRLIIWDFLGEYDGYDIHEKMSGFVNASKEKVFQISLRMELDYFPYVCERIDHMQDVCFVVEEASAVCTPHVITKHHERIIRFGRHGRIDQIYNTQMPSDLHPLILGNSDIVNCFHMHHRANLQALSKYITVENLPKLQELQYVECDLRKHTEIKKVLTFKD